MDAVPDADAARTPGGARSVALERRRRTVEFGYRVCGLWHGEVVDGHPRICVQPKGHTSSPHRDAKGEDLPEPQ